MTDTPDPIAEAAPQPAITPPAAPKPRSAVLPLLGGVAAAVLGFGLAQVVPDGWPFGPTTTLQADLTAQTAEIAALKVTVNQLSEQGQPAPDKELAARVSAVEAALASAAAPDLAPLTRRIDALDQSLTELAAQPQAAGSIDQAQVAQLQAAVADLKANGIPAAALAQVTAAFDAKLAEADSRIAAIRTEADAIAKTAANRAALSQLLAALDSGAPYSSAVAGLSGVALPDVILTNAPTGLPSLQALRDSFPAAARLALEAALRADPGQSWTDRVQSFLRGQTGARSLSPREGTDPDAVLSRAEAALATGNLTAALTEIDTLPPAALAAMSDWLARAKVRQDAAAALQDLLAKAEL